MIKQEIFINGRFLTQPITGVQRYCHELLRGMDGLLEMEEYRGLKLTCLVPPGNFHYPAWHNIEIRVIGKNRGNLWEQMDLPLTIKNSFLFSPANLGPVFHKNQAVTFHDASVYAIPQAYSWMFRLKYKIGFKLLAQNAKLLLTDSDFSKRELSHYLGIPANRFHKVVLGGDHMSRLRADEGILDEYNLRGKPYFLTVASLSPHKNMTRLIEAVTRLGNGENRFVFAGGKNRLVFQNENRDNIPANIILTGYVDDYALKALYEHAAGFVLPSLYEGFGLPVLEAMSCDCPVLCSRAASLPEAGGDAVMYFDPQDADSIVAAIVRFLSEPGLREEMRSKGRVHVQKFTWQKTARQTLDLLVS